MKAEKHKRSKHFYSSDRPIRSKKDDVLKRAKFAERLADDLKSWDGNDSLIVALYGAWGSGKSSVKNMVLEAVRRKRAATIPVMEFNPWQLSGTGDIPATFFRELGIALGEEGPPRDVSRRAAKLKYYSGLLTLAGSVAKSIGSLRTLLGKPDGPVIEAAAGGLAAAASVSKKGSEALATKGDAEGKSLHELKVELCSLMAKLPRPVLVVIDDIDRLSADEILQVFQLVKANADFPRLVFLLLFERGVVTSALNAISDNRGSEFLEKIVQVGYHIPHASRSAVQKALFTGLDSHLSTEAVSKRWEKRRWSNLFADGIGSYFRNLRHVKRFLASFAFHIREHRSENSFEVNPVDLIGLETLRVFEPAVYERLPGAKTILTRYEGPSLFGEIKQEVVDQALSQIVSTVSPENQVRVKAILEVLFPPISPAYGGKREVSNHHQEWLRELRVCHPDFFDKYFTLTVGDDDLSQSELDSLLALTADTKNFVSACEALKKRGLLNLAFDRLDAYKEQIPLQAMPSLVQALCDMSDGFPERLPKPFEQMFEHELNVHAWRLCYFGLKREPDKKKRFQILHDAISRSAGIALPFEFVSLDERAGDREARGHEFLLEESDVEVLKKICIQKFREALKHDNIRQSPQFRLVLFRWSAWESADEVKSLMKGQILTSADALWLLTVLLGESHSYGHDHKVRYSMTLGSLERFTDISQLSDLLAKVKASNRAKREAIALREFNKALKRRAEGKPDNVGDMMHDPDEEVVE
ncbi:MAG TPA: P-loop NTPase fold protein [Verrucomicrobiae bacterium]|nr:P-loop NTPase fold protein [Verrucomicrobiae bacterium]